jgi:hypothetical protein
LNSLIKSEVRTGIDGGLGNDQAGTGRVIGSLLIEGGIHHFERMRAPVVPVASAVHDLSPGASITLKDQV